ncbi:hypothetical protein M422DRAFT_273086 [Sphaerobolus stellatus SS14]|uniref:Uncharacterized protein n=1 Tax=Sphaerobolus stellatus (strain SS14) TaxID=990650 RepID=A0A0C9TA21_SPHS4|nr:hypothetical protein M422DRAFT_273086 [Sphaerobolus stellatus SS14]
MTLQAIPYVPVVPQPSPLPVLLTTLSKLWVAGVPTLGTSIYASTRYCFKLSYTVILPSKPNLLLLAPPSPPILFLLGYRIGYQEYYFIWMAPSTEHTYPAVLLAHSQFLPIRSNLNARLHRANRWRYSLRHCVDPCFAIFPSSSSLLAAGYKFAQALKEEEEGHRRFPILRRIHASLPRRTALIFRSPSRCSL